MISLRTFASIQESNADLDATFFHLPLAYLRYNVAAFVNPCPSAWPARVCLVALIVLLR